MSSPFNHQTAKPPTAVQDTYKSEIGCYDSQHLLGGCKNKTKPSNIKNVLGVAQVLVDVVGLGLSRPTNGVDRFRTVDEKDHVCLPLFVIFGELDGPWVVTFVGFVLLVFKCFPTLPYVLSH